MADNVELDAGSGGAVIATDDDGTAQHQYVKIEFGGDGTFTKVTSAVGLPIVPATGATFDLGATDNAVLDAIAASLAGTLTVGSHAVTNAGTFSVQESGGVLTALQLIDDAVYTDGTGTPSKGIAVMGTDGTNPQIISVDSSGNVQVDLVSANVTNSGTFAVQVDGTALTRLTDIETNTDSGAVVGNGAAATAQRVTLANDSTGVIGTITTVTTVSAVTAITNALPAGTNNIGDVDVASIAAGDNNIGNVDIVTVPTDPFGANADAASATGSISAKLRFIASTGIPITGTVTVASHAVTNAGTFAVQAAQSGTWTVDLGATDNAVLDAIAASLAGTLTVGSHAVTNAGTFAVQESGAALTSLQLADDVVYTDDTAFTPGTSKLTVIGAQADEDSTDSVDEGDAGALRMTLERKLRTVAALDSAAMQSGNDQVTPKFAAIDAASSGDNTIVAAVASKKLRVLSAFLVSAGTVTARFESGAGGTALTGQMNLIANSGFVLPFNPVGWFETATNTLLNLELSGAVSVDGSLTYIEVD